jgi:uncharacterized protein (DUF983 family)
MLARGLVRRCARCGGRGAFLTGWYSMADRCRTCGLAWRRNMEGFQLGAAAINIILTGGSLLAVMGAGVVLTYPEPPVWPLVAVVGYPVSYTVWLAVDLAMNPLSDEEIADADAHRAT